MGAAAAGAACLEHAVQVLKGAPPPEVAAGGVALGLARLLRLEQPALFCWGGGGVVRGVAVRKRVAKQQMMLSNNAAAEAPPA